jgi:hypothetical protein
MNRRRLMIGATALAVIPALPRPAPGSDGEAFLAAVQELPNVKKVLLAEMIRHKGGPLSAELADAICAFAASCAREERA